MIELADRGYLDVIVRKDLIKAQLGTQADESTMCFTRVAVLLSCFMSDCALAATHDNIKKAAIAKVLFFISSSF